MTAETPAVPDGFVPLPFLFGFVGVNGPLWLKRDGDKLHLGFRAEERHCNPMRIVHGGMLATFADMQLPFGARYQAGMPSTFLPTVNLSLDYIAPAKMGAWIEGETEVLRKTRSFVFAQCRITADGELAVRANGLFKIGPEISFPGEMDALLKRP